MLVVKLALARSLREEEFLALRMLEAERLLEASATGRHLVGSTRAAGDGSPSPAADGSPGSRFDGSTGARVDGSTAERGDASAEYSVDGSSRTSSDGTVSGG